MLLGIGGLALGGFALYSHSAKSASTSSRSCPPGYEQGGGICIPDTLSDTSGDFSSGRT